MSLFNTGLIIKESGEPGRAVDIFQGMNSLTGLSLSNDGPSVAILQLVGTDTGIIPLEDQPLSASDTRLFGHWIMIPGEYVFISASIGASDYPIAAVEFAGLTDYSLLLFSKGKAVVGYSARGEAV